MEMCELIFKGTCTIEQLLRANVWEKCMGEMYVRACCHVHLLGAYACGPMLTT